MNLPKYTMRRGGFIEHSLVWIKCVLRPKVAPILFAVLTIPLLSLASEYVIEVFTEYAYRSKVDMRGYIANRVKTDFSSKPTVYNIGGSGMLRALDEDYKLERKFNKKIGFVNIAYSGQTNVESLMLIKHVNLKKDDLVVLHASISRVNRVYPYEAYICSPYISALYYRDVVHTLDSLDLHEYDAPKSCNVSWIAKKSYLITIKNNIERELNGHKVIKFRGIYPLAIEKSESALEVKRQRVLKAQRKNSQFTERWLELNGESAEKYIHIIRSIEEYVGSKGAKLILLDPPQNIEWFERYHPYMDQPYIERYKDIFLKLKAFGIKYYDLRRDPLYTYDDFYDHQHMITSGRGKFFPAYRDLIMTEMR